MKKKSKYSRTDRLKLMDDLRLARAKAAYALDERKELRKLELSKRKAAAQLRAATFHQSFETAEDKAKALELLKIGSFEQEEFRKSGYEPVSGKVWGRATAKRKCLKCNKKFDSTGIANRLCWPCQDQRDFLGEEWSHGGRHGSNYEGG